MDFIFNPKSIAVVGASAQKGKWGNEPLKNILQAKFQGKVSPINPKGGEILGIKAFKSVKWPTCQTTSSGSRKSSSFEIEGS